jgi:hypothetical protein
MIRKGKDQTPPLFCPSWKWRRTILTLVLYIRNERRTRFCVKRRRVYFRYERRNGRRARFHDKRRRAPTNMCLLYLHNQRCIIGARVSLLLQKWTLLRYKLNWDVQKKDRLIFFSTELVPLLNDAGASHFSRSETITFALVSNLCLWFEFLTYWDVSHSIKVRRVKLTSSFWCLMWLYGDIKAKRQIL